MALVFGRRRQLVSRTLNANTSVAIPIDVSRLEQASGRGSDGRPGGTRWYMAQFRQDTFTDKASGAVSVGAAQYVGQTDSYQGAPEPLDEYFNVVDNAIYRQDRHVWYSNLSETTSPTNGDAATGFGKVFGGGVGGPAVVTTFNNIAITPGASYNVVVPVGGSITISYYQ